MSTIVDKEKLFEDLIDTFFKSATVNKVPAFAIGVMDSNKVIGAKTFGIKKIGLIEPVNKDTLFPIGSITKSFVALGILLLVQNGKLKLEDPFDKYLPLKLSKTYKPITIHHLLSHSSGINGINIAGISANHLHPSKNFLLPIGSWEDFYYYINNFPDELMFEPGTAFSYLNVGYSLLGKIIETISATSLSNYIKENIFIPLGLTRAIMNENDYINDKNKTYGHQMDKDHQPKPNPFDFYEFKNAGGSILLSPEHFIKYIMFYLNEGMVNGKQFISKDLFNKMESFQIEIKSENWEKHGYGYGLFKYNSIKGYTFNGHSGGVEGGCSFFIYSRELDLGITLMFNGILEMTAPLVKSIAKHINNEQPFILQKDKLTNIYNKLIGKYQAYNPSISFQIEKKGSYLELNSEYFKGMLIPSETNSSNSYYVISSAGLRIPVQFEEIDKDIILIVDELKLKKV